jgi:precorrin-2 dehydrogenase/sirohydrochlorin ferrochelatase
MKFLPIGLKIAGKKILLVGGGKVALQKIRRLKPFTSNLTVLAREISHAVKKTGVRCLKGNYQPACLKGFSLIYACTDDAALNHRIHRDANRLGILVNVVDCPSESDFVSPAIYKKGPMTVAVSSDGWNAKRSVLWRDRIKESLRTKEKSRR